MKRVQELLIESEREGERERGKKRGEERRGEERRGEERMKGSETDQWPHG